jgi:HEAT repeat protein
MKKIIVLFVLAVGIFTATFAQTDGRTRETKIADIVMLLPANNTATFNRLMGELIELGDVIGDLAPRLVDSGDSDVQLRYAVSGLAMYVSKDANRKPLVAKSLCDAIPKAKSDEIRDFLFIQLQYVAGDESVETVAQYLDNERLCDAAARVLVRINKPSAGIALGKALQKGATVAQQITLVQALGEMRFQPLHNLVAELAMTKDEKLRRAALHSLAMMTILPPSSEKVLIDAVEKANYKYEPTDELGSYVLFLKNNLQADPSDYKPIVTPDGKLKKVTPPSVTKAARKMLKATSETAPPREYIMITPGVIVPSGSKSYSYTQIAAKSAALEILTLSAGEKAISEIINALKSGDKEYRQAALKYSVNIKSPKMYNELMKFAKKEKRPEVKAELITAFGERGDIAAWTFVQECLTDKNGNIRTAAIVTAGKIARADAVTPIVKAINTGDEQVVAAGKNTLLTIADEKVVTEIAAAISQTSVPAKIAFLEILASRRAESHVGTVFAQTSSTDAGVRLAALKALASVVTVKDVPRIAELLNAASDKNEIAALQRAMFAAVSTESQEEHTDIVVNEATKSPNQSAYFNVLAMIGGEKALNLLMIFGFYSDDTNVKEAAFEALLNWGDAFAVPQLYRIAAGDPSGAYFDKALSAYISKTEKSKNTPEQKLLMLRDALDIAETPAQKQTILQQIARTGALVGLLTAGKYLDDSNNDVQQAAVQAVRTIALAHPEYYGPEITSLLNRAMAVNKDPEADYQKQAILKHLAGLPTDGGFVSMFNGRDLAGWKGLVKNPIARSKMTSKELAENQVKADEIMRRDWKVIDGLLVFEGKGYDNLCSEKDYADFEMYVDWRISDKGDAGIYLRGSPQVQIWDIRNKNAHVGSGGLYNNQKHLKDPLVVADNPVNEWNSFYIKMISEKVIVYLNGQLVVDNITLENYWDRNLPIFEKDAIELQAHGDRVEYRDLYVREIPRPEPYRVSDEEKADGFVPMFNGIDMSGWVGNLIDYVPRDGAIVCDPSLGGRGNLFTETEYSDFVIRFEFKLTPATNNGVAIRVPPNANRPAYEGMEIQVLDDDAEVYRTLEPHQYHGSVYGVIAAKRGHLKPVGEWNTQEIIADGYRIRITLNGTVILDGDLAEASKNFTETVDGLPHPGISNKKGQIGFLGHGSEVAFRNLRIKELKKDK